MRELASEPASEPGSEEEDDDKSRGHWELQNPFSVPDAEDEEEARQLDRELRPEHLSLQEGATDTNPAAAQQLGKILFMRKTVTHDGRSTSTR